MFDKTITHLLEAQQSLVLAKTAGDLPELAVDLIQMTQRMVVKIIEQCEYEKRRLEGENVNGHVMGG
jgi:hypothetical protein